MLFSYQAEIISKSLKGNLIFVAIIKYNLFPHKMLFSIVYSFSYFS